MGLIVTGVTNSSIVLQRVHIRRTHDVTVACEGLVVAFDAVMVVEIVDHDAEGFPGCHVARSCRAN